MNAKSLRHSQTGSTILYVLFILFVITLLATTVTTIMLRNNRVTTGLSQSLRASYAASSGAEHALYYTQYARTAKTVGAQGTVDAISAFTSTFDNDASYSIVATVTDDAYTADIAQNTSQQWDIFGENYDNGYVLAPLDDLDYITISWNENSTSCSAVAGASRVEVSFSSWTQFTWEDISDPDVIQTRYIYTCPGSGGGFDCTGPSLGVDSTHLYKVRVKPLDCDVEDVTVSAFDSTSTAIDTKNLMNITSTGEFNFSTRATVDVTALWDARLKHYFDFVIFSENKIIK